MNPQMMLRKLDRVRLELITRVGLITSMTWWVVYSRPIPNNPAKDSGWEVKRSVEVMQENVLCETVGYGFKTFGEAREFFDINVRALVPNFNPSEVPA